MDSKGTNGRDDRRGRFTETKGGNQMIRKLVTTTGMLVAGAALFLGSGFLGSGPLATAPAFADSARFRCTAIPSSASPPTAASASTSPGAICTIG